MTSEEALEWALKIPEAERTKVQARTIVFLQTIKDSPNKAAWEDVRVRQLPADIEAKILDRSGPKETP